MRMTIFKVLPTAVMLICAVPLAQGGVLRYLGHKIKGGSQQAATTTAGAGETAGKATAGAAVTGADATKQGAEAVGGGAAAAGTATAKGAEQVPGATAHGVSAGAKAVWKAVW